MRDKPFNQDLVEYVAKRMAMEADRGICSNRWEINWHMYLDDARLALKARRDWKNDVDVTDNE